MFVFFSSLPVLLSLINTHLSNGDYSRPRRDTLELLNITTARRERQGSRGRHPHLIRSHRLVVVVPGRRAGGGVRT